MSIIKLVQSKEFKEKNQFDKRKYVKEHILTESFCKVGSSILCFELETICDEKYRYFYNQTANVQKIKNMTIGKFYKILDYKNRKIKLINDIGEPHWYTIKRFLRSLKIERNEKLKRIIKNERC